MSLSPTPRPPQQPPPLPGEQRSKQASAQVSRAQPDSKKQKPKKRSNLTWLWVLLLLIGGVGYWTWRYQIAQQAIYGFQPPEMAMARYTPKDVIGDLGGLKVRIPRHYAEYVEYDDDPGWGKKREGPIPERTFDSRLSSFGISVRFPDMKGLENEELKKELRDNFLNPNNPWIRIGINAGEIYPSMGANARNGLAKHLWEPSPYWWNNYERLPEDVYGLEAYVLSGVHPKTGLPAREQHNTEDVYIQRDPSGHVNTYIACSKTTVPGGVGTCSLFFGLEPTAEVDVKVNFRPSLLSHWKEIQESSRDLLLSFEAKEKIQSQ